MSNGQILGGAIGAAAGFVLAGPAGAYFGTTITGGMGALYGAQIGMMAGGYLDPPKGPTMEGPRLSDLSVQTSTYGAFIPRLYGTVGINGNVFWLEHNKLKEVVKKKKSGGKGGGSSATTKTYTYFATVAVGLCEGPVDGIRRIWAGPTLIYDAGAGDIDSIIASNATKQRNFSFYYGDDTQLPDSRMQADLGAANTPAYRGLCYVVIKDFALAKYGNAIPAFKFEVVKRAASPSTIFNEDAWTIPDVYNSNLVSGTPMDSRGAMCYTYQPAYLAPILFVSEFDDGRRYTAELPAAWSSAYIPFACQPLAKSLRKSRFAFQSLYYTMYAPAICWGDGEGNNYRYEFASISGVDIQSFAEDDDRNGFAIIGNAAPYTLIAIGKGTLLASIVLPSGLVPMLTVYGENVVLIHHAGTQLDVRLYSFDLTLVDSYSIAGITKDANVTYSVNGSGSPVSDSGVCVLTSAPDGSVYRSYQEVVAVNLAERSAVVYQFPEPASWTDPLKGMSIDLGGVVAFSQKDTATSIRRMMWKLEDQTEETTSLQEIISAECALTGLLSPSDIDVTSLTDTATGYRVAKIGSIRNSIEPLQAVWPFDAVQSGYQIKFRRRGLSSVAAVTSGDLGVDQQLKQVREMDSQLPNSLVCNFLDRGRNYDTNQQTWERPSTGAVNTRTMEIPAVLTATQAAQVIERLGYLYWLERVEFGPFSLPPTFSHLEPADVVTLTTDYATYELRLTSVNYKSDGSLECSARLNNASTYTSLAAADDVDDGATVGRAGPSSYLLLDVPVVDETLQNTPGVVSVMCGYTPSWSGGAIWRSPDAGQSWDDIQGFSAPCTFGKARGLLQAHDGNIIDYGRTLTVDLFAGELVGVAESQMLNGANIAAYGVEGRWEIMRFTNATLNADGSYTISGLWRGDKGTEWATGLHVAGDSFVLLDDPDGAFIGIATELIGTPRYYRGITNEADIDSDSSLTFTYAGANLECLSPVHAAGSRSAGDLLMTWKRRTRVGGAWRDYVDAYLGESVESYEVDVMDGATVKRTIIAATQTATYTSAQQTTDFGSAQASITVRIYQLSSTVGRGYPLEVTL